MNKKDRSQIVAILKDWLKKKEKIRSKKDEIEILRIWRKGDALNVRYTFLSLDLLNLVRKGEGLAPEPYPVVCYDLISILDEKERRFGVRSISHS